MEYTNAPTLQLSASLRIVLVLWNQPDIVEKVNKFKFSKEFLSERHIFMGWKVIRDEVVAKIEKLPYLGFVKNEVLRVVNVVAWQIYVYGRHDLKLGKVSLKELRWTPHGSLDKRRSAEEFVKNRRHSGGARLRIAYCHCLEDYMKSSSGDLSYNNDVSWYETEATMFWSRQFRVKRSSIFFEEVNVVANQSSAFYSLFRRAVECGFETGCKYFWRKIHKTVTKDVLVEMAIQAARNRVTRIGGITQIPHQSHSDVFSFLLSEMTPDQKMEVFRKEPSCALVCFLDWPRQQYFPQTINNIWDCLTGEHCLKVLTHIVNKELAEFIDYNYSYLLRECVRGMPPTHKRYIVDNCAEKMSDSLVSKLFYVNDTSVVSSLLYHGDAETKEKIFFSSEGGNICVSLANECRWDLLSDFIDACMQRKSKSEIIRFKNKVESYVSLYCFKMRLAEGETALRKIFDIVDKLTSNELDK